jgi:hypothetical protein
VEGRLKCGADALVSESVKCYCCDPFRTLLKVGVLMLCLFCKHNLMYTFPLIAMLVLLSSREHMSLGVCCRLFSSRHIETGGCEHSSVLQSKLCCELAGSGVCVCVWGGGGHSLQGSPSPPSVVIHHFRKSSGEMEDEKLKRGTWCRPGSWLGLKVIKFGLV